MGKLVQFHIKEVDGKFPIEIAKFVFPVLGWRKVFGKLFQVPLIVRAVVVDAFMDAEMFPALDRLECMAAIRAL